MAPSQRHGVRRATTNAFTHPTHHILDEQQQALRKLGRSTQAVNKIYYLTGTFVRQERCALLMTAQEAKGKSGKKKLQSLVHEGGREQS